jgi:lipoyl(octanoyl) transferase
MPQVKFIDLGLKDYKETWDYQEELFSQMLEKKKNNVSDDFAGYMLFVEHPHVYTLGKSGTANNLLVSEPFLQKIQATYYRINRGGDITYHGPGQLVGYPILDLEKFGMGVREYIESLEDSIIGIVGRYGISSGRLDGATGVWLESDTPKARKICAIGVRASRYVTMHGFALNVNTQLNYFSYINPCGFQDKGVTSIQNEKNAIQDFDVLKNIAKDEITQRFNIKWIE